LVANLNLEKKLYNGSRGVVVDFEEDNGKYTPLVQFENVNEVFLIREHNWEIPQTDKHIRSIIYSQIPLVLGYALTIHKSQSLTLDSAYIDCSRIFEAGQLYTALSRVRTLGGLYLNHFDLKYIKTDERVIEYYKKLERE